LSLWPGDSRASRRDPAVAGTAQCRLAQIARTPDAQPSGGPTL